MKKLNNKILLGLLILSISFGTMTYSASSGTLGSLFNYISGNENGVGVTNVYRLEGTFIEDGTVTSYEIKDNSITDSDLAANSVGTSEVIDNSLTANDLATNSVGSSEISTNAVGSSEVIDNSLTANDLATNSVGNSELIDSPTFTTVYASQYNLTSDIIYKENIIKLSDSLNKILNINGYSYTLKDNGKKDIGIIAQEVEKIYPELVTTGENGHKSVQYVNLIAPLIEAIREQQQSINKLKEEVKFLKNK